MVGEEIESAQVIVFLHVYLQMVSKNIVNTNFLLEADMMRKAAVTGGVSAKMLRDVGCDYVLLGHSGEEFSLMRMMMEYIKSLNRLMLV